VPSEYSLTQGWQVDGRPTLTGVDPNAVGDYVILMVRDPLCGYKDDPAETVAARLQGAREIGRGVMFTSWTGTYQGASITVVSGGSGSPEAELVLHELLNYTSATTFLRVGGSGGLHPSVHPGDIVIASGVVRDEGMTAAYVPPSWPAAAAPELVLALAQAAYEAKVPFHVGLTRSVDSDFVGTGRPGVAGYLQPWNEAVVDVYRRAQVLNTDRESAAVVTLARLFGRRGGAVCSVADNVSTGDSLSIGAGHQNAIEVALNGLAVLHRMDEIAKAAGAPLWLPMMGTGHSFGGAWEGEKQSKPE
jgi:uridine phosphorylase